MNLEEAYVSMSKTDLERFVATAQEEHLLLDFKNVSSGELSNDDKRNFARALSGFANSSGGLVVWGVDARKNPQGVDCAVALKPVANAALLVSRLNELTGSSATPIVDGVRHRAIADPDGSGFAVTIVPESLGGPHMAKAHEDKYFKRSGDRLYPMEHFDLADRFGRRSKPRLGLHTRIVSGGSTGGGGTTTYKAKLVLGIENSGRGAASAPYLDLTIAMPYGIDRGGLDGNHNEGLPRLPVASGGTVRYGASADTVVHIGVVLEVAAVELSASADHKARLTMPKPLSVSYTIAAQGAVPVTGVFEMDSDAVARAAYPPALYPIPPQIIAQSS